MPGTWIPIWQMTAILALLNRDGQPADPIIIDGMLAPTKYRARDGEDTWMEGSVALAHQHFWLTPEELDERQPLVNAIEGLVMACDARLDNRTALIEQLGLEQIFGAELSDAELVLRAYRHWGTRCAEHLLGAFVFALWDARQQQLFVARDPLGERAIYYYLDEHVCLVASEIAQILAHPSVRAQLNEAEIAEYLVGYWSYEDETFFHSIYPCPPAHWLLVKRDSFRKERYWDINPAGRIRYREHNEYVEHFRSLLTAAVRCRLRTTGPVGISLSGGMDSLSIAAMAAHLLPQTAYHRDRLRSFSYVFDQLSSCDERQYIKPVVQHFGIDATYITGDELWPLRDLADWPVYHDMPAQDPFLWLAVAVHEAARAGGCCLILSGLFGDEVFSGSDFWTADMLRDFRMSELLLELWRRRTEVNCRLDIFDNGIRQLLPHGARQAYRRLRPRRIQESHPGLHPALVARVGLAERIEAARYNSRYSAPGQWSRYRLLISPDVSESVAALRQFALQYGMESTDPFMDRRLVEFSMAVPADELGLPWRTKRLLRDAMRGLLPEMARERVGKTSLVPLLEKGLLVEEQATVRRLLEDPQIVRMELVRAEWLRDELAAGRNWSHDGYYLWISLCLEIWLNRCWSYR